MAKYTVEEAMAKTGTETPRQALERMNAGRKGRSRFVYMPHVGRREREKAARRLEKMREHAK